MRPPVNTAIYVGDHCWGGLALLVREALAIAGTLHARNADLRAAELFQARLVALAGQPVRSFTGPALQPEALLQEMPLPQVVIVPPFYLPLGAPSPVAPAVREWLRRAYDGGALLVGMAGGVRLLAEIGLLDGRSATGNLADQCVFARHYPAVRFQPDTPLVIDGRLITAGSINPCLDACRYLVQHFYGAAAAHKFARYTHANVAPAPHVPGQDDLKQHVDQRIRLAQEYIERHCRQDLTVAAVAQRAAMSERNFSRRFQQAVGMAPHLYIARCRSEVARTLLARPGVSMLQVALQSGFRSEAMLRRAFGQSFGQSPAAYRATLASRPR